MSDFRGLLHRSRRTNYQGLMDNLLRKATPDRVYFMELFHDGEVRDAIADRFDLVDGLDPNAPNFARLKTIAVNRFCGWDYVVAGVSVNFQHHGATVGDSAAMARSGGRRWIGPWVSLEIVPTHDRAGVLVLVPPAATAGHRGASPCTINGISWPPWRKNCWVSIGFALSGYWSLIASGRSGAAMTWASRRGC